MRQTHMGSTVKCHVSIQRNSILDAYFTCSAILKIWQDHTRPPSYLPYAIYINLGLSILYIVLEQVMPLSCWAPIPFVQGERDWTSLVEEVAAVRNLGHHWKSSAPIWLKRGFALVLADPCASCATLALTQKHFCKKARIGQKPKQGKCICARVGLLMQLLVRACSSSLQPDAAMGIHDIHGHPWTPRDSEVTKDFFHWRGIQVEEALIAKADE